MGYINITVEKKVKLPKLKKVKEKKIKPIKEKKIKKPRQYTKILMDMLIFLAYITTLSGIYINFKNGFSMDSIVSSILDVIKYVVPAYACKSFFETKEEKLMEFQEKHFEDIVNNGNQNIEKDV